MKKHMQIGIAAGMVLALLTALAPRAEAANTNKYWNPASGNSWNTAGNWSPSGVPGSGDVAIFDGTTNNANCTLDATVNVAGLALTNGYSGTVTQGTIAITVGASGWNQSGGAFSGGTNLITLNGPWSLSGGTFNAGNQTIRANPAATNWACNGGAFNAGSSTVSFYPDTVSGGNGTITISGSQSFNNLTLNGVYFTRTDTIAVPAGTTLTVTNTLSLYDGSANNVGVSFSGTGTIAAQGNIVATYLRANNAYAGTVRLLINGAGDQTFTNGGAILSKVEINKPGGTLSLVGTNRVSGAFNGSYAGSWTYTAGTLDAGTSTIYFYGENGGLTITGSHTLNNVYFAPVDGTHGNSTTIAAGTTLTVAGTLTFSAASGNKGPNINTGAINAAGDVNMPLAANCIGSAVLNFTGSATQQVSYFGDTGSRFRLSPVTVNKSGGSVNLATNLSLGTAGQQLVWTNGAINLLSNTLTVAGTTTIYPGATTLGVTVADATKAGRLACSNAVSGITNVALAVSVAAAPEVVAGQTYMVLTNSAVLASPFESVTWIGAWKGEVAYTGSGGKTVTLGNIRRADRGTAVFLR